MNYPLSPMQQAMLVASLGNAAQDLYVVQTVFEWRENIRAAEFAKAWEILAGRHEVLRSTFGWRTTSAPYQTVADKVRVALEQHVSAAAQPAAKRSALHAFLGSDLARGVSLSEGPPWRVSLLRFANGNAAAVWTFHHILLDGRSHVLLIRELLAIYDGLLCGDKGATGAAERPEIPQGRYAAWLTGLDFSASRGYWAQYLNAEKVSTALPPPVGETRDAVGHSSYDLWLGSDLAGSIRAFAKEEGVSGGTLLHAAWALTLGWLAGERDVTFGAVRACRKAAFPEGENVIGLMINTLPLRVAWQEDTPLRRLVQAIARDWREFRGHELTPLQQICQWIGLPTQRDIFTSAVSFSSDYLPRAVHGDAAVRAERDVWVRQTVPYCAIDGGFDIDDFHIALSIPDSLVDRPLAARLPGYLRNALAAIVRAPASRAGDVCLLESAERKQIAYDFNPRREPLPGAVDWLAALDRQAQLRGGQTAVEAGTGAETRRLNWRQLEARSNRLAQRLRGRGVGPEDLVGVLLERSPEYVWVCLGIMKAGAAYLPLDPQWPAERIAYVLEDAGVKELVSSAELTPPRQIQPIFEHEISPDPADPVETIPPLPQQLAYVIYTSGSTGLPKGVEITQGGLQNLIADMNARFGISAADRASFVSNTAFDATVHELWPALSAGASIHIPGAEICRDPRALLDWLAAAGITFSFLSTAMAEAILPMDRSRYPLALRYLLTGGDHLRRLPDADYGFELVNEYGPTECTVVATRHEVVPRLDAQRNIPIGKPIRGTRAYVVNKLGRLLPLGVPGELLLAGNGLARGYRGQSALTAAKFTVSSIVEEPGPVLYRTGDLVRWLPEGALQFLSRTDTQVKLRGFRIELGEIEACLRKHPGVLEALVALTETAANPRLLAAVVARSQPPAPDFDQALAAHLRKLLPAYMIPAGFLFLDALPLNSSGKYDRKAVAALPCVEADSAAGTPPESLSEAESKMLRLWERVLGVAPVKPDDRFLELGGTSLSIIQLIVAIESSFGRTVSAAAVLSDPRPGDLLRIIEAQAPPETPLIVPLKRSGAKTPLFLVPGAGGGVHWFRELAHKMDADQPVFGLELLSLSAAVQQDFSVAGAAREFTQALLSAGPGEPLTLGGYSGGGLVALETAAQLERAGRRVRNVILIETYPAEQLADVPAKFARWVRGWLALPADQRWKTLRHRMRWYARAKLAAEPPDRLSQDLQALKERHIRAFIASPLPSFRGEIVILSAESRPLSVGCNPWGEWEKALRVKFRVIRVPGDHFTLLNGVNAEILAGWLSRLAAGMDQIPVPQTAE